MRLRAANRKRFGHDRTTARREGAAVVLSFEASGADQLQLLIDWIAAVMPDSE